MKLLPLAAVAAATALAVTTADEAYAKAAGLRRLVGGLGLYVKPTADSFYQAPANLATYKEGTIIRERDVTLAIGGAIGSILSFSKASQLLYRTQTALGKPDATVTTVFRPYNPQRPAKVVSVALFEDSAAKDCANSYAMIRGSFSQHSLLVAAQAPLISSLLSKGYYVSAPDFQGSKAAFIAGFAEGRAQLDSIRAILQHKPTIADTTGNKIILTGYSGGGHTIAWAAQLAQEYAPELNIIGGAYGGVPVDLQNVLVGLNRGLFAGFGIAGLTGVANAYPEIQAFLDQHLLPNGTDAIKFLRSDQGCIPGELVVFALKDYFTYFDVGSGLLTDPVVQRILKLNLLGARGARDLVTQFPRYIYHASNDEVISIDPARQYVADQCAGGASIEFSISQGTEHVIEAVTGIPGAVKWIVSRFEGTFQQKGCTNTTHNLFGAESILGTPAYNQLKLYQNLSVDQLRSYF